VKRGDLVSIALQGDYGKPRPALVIQSNFFAAHPSITVLPLTSAHRELPLFRIPVEPSPVNGLAKMSDVMVDKCMTVRREKVGGLIGRLEDERMVEITRALAVFLGIG